VHGNKAVVPNNWFYTSEVRYSCRFLKTIFDWGLLPATMHKIIQWCPFLLSQKSLGVE